MAPVKMGMLALLGMFLATATAQAQRDPEIAEGGKIYQKQCKVCHGENGDGQTF
ncbi:MAG: c-type cytochrome, partial [Nitrospinales bacterium]